MKNSFKSNDELKEEEVLKMIDDTSKLVAKKNINVLIISSVFNIFSILKYSFLFVIFIFTNYTSCFSDFSN